MNEMRRRLKGVAILSLLGTPSYMLCSSRHICMAGHMQHGPYPVYQFVTDFWWMVCFAAVFAFSLRLKARRKMWFLCGSLILIVLRIPLDSSGIIFELALLIILDVFAIQYLVKPEEYIASGE